MMIIGARKGIILPRQRASGIIAGTRIGSSAPPSVFTPAQFKSMSYVEYGSRTNTTVPAPAGLADNDIIIAASFSADVGTAPDIGLPSGFVVKDTNTSVTDSGNFNAKLGISWKRASSEGLEYLFTHSSASSQICLIAISDAVLTGDPIAAISRNQGSGEDIIALSIDTTEADQLVLNCAHNWSGASLSFPAVS